MSDFNLFQDIYRQIQLAGGSIPFSTFMETALYHPTFGYYMRENIGFGMVGDFTTAPEISPLFARCIARQCLQILPLLKKSAILEIGAGSGRLAGEIIQTLATDGYHLPHYFIYEISPTLRKQQQIYIKKHYPEKVHCFTWLEILPEHFVGIIIANEVLDALPVDCFAIQNNKIFERQVAFNGKNFYWHLMQSDNPIFYHSIEKIRNRYQLDDYQSEINLRLPQYLQNLTQHLQQGLILLIDYGYGERLYYHPERNQGTLTAFHHHERCDPLTKVGQQDLTAHVNFTQVAEIAHGASCVLEGFVTQAAFLLSCGLIAEAEKASQNLNPEERMKMHQAIKLLTFPTEMGECVKVMALSKGIKKTPQLIGFAKQDRTREL